MSTTKTKRRSEIAKARDKVRRRNLFMRGERIYYRRWVKGNLQKWSTKTNDWDAAAEMRDLWEKREGIGRTSTNGTPQRSTTFAEVTERHLKTGMSHLAATTRCDLEGQLKADVFLQLG